MKAEEYKALSTTENMAELLEEKDQEISKLKLIIEKYSQYLTQNQLEEIQRCNCTYNEFTGRSKRPNKHCKKCKGVGINKLFKGLSNDA